MKKIMHEFFMGERFTYLNQRTKLILGELNKSTHTLSELTF